MSKMSSTAKTLKQQLERARLEVAFALAQKLPGNNVTRYRTARRRVVRLERLQAARKGRTR